MAHVAQVAYALLLVAVGSGIGGIGRYFVSGVVGRRIGETFPWGTLVVNVLGSAAIGVLAAAADREMLFDRPEPWLLVVVGFLGSFTTVSSFSLQTLALLRDGQKLRALANVLLSLALCLAAVILGFVAGEAVLR